MSGVGTPLVVVETRGGVPTEGGLGLLGLARRLAGSATAVIFGADAAAVAPQLAAHGADVVHACDDERIDPGLGQALAAVVEAVVRELDITTVLVENSVTGADLAAALAVRLGAGVNWDLTGLDLVGERLVGSRLALNDTVAVEAGWTSPVRIGVFRLGAIEPEAVPRAGAGRIMPVAADAPEHSLRPRVTARTTAGSEGAALAAADVIVAGGRGMKSPDTMAILQDLADALGGSVAVSAPIVDRGWAPHSKQVGQTGTRVRPRLYIACGISGQLAHRVGMEKSGYVVAINTDASAPIFGMCDAGVVGDLHEIVPELARLLRERAAGS